MEFPKLGQNNSLSDQSLLLGSVETASIKETELEPSSAWVSVRNSSLIIPPVLVGFLERLWSIVPTILGTIFTEILVELSELSLNVNLTRPVLPSLYLTVR